MSRLFRERALCCLHAVVATKSRIGYLIWNSWELLQVDIMFFGIVTIGILGLITSAQFQDIERKVVPWKAES